MTATAFLDSNIILRHVLRDDVFQWPLATAFLKQVEQGAMTVATSWVVVLETVCTLERRYRLSKAHIRDAVEPVLALQGIELQEKSLLGPAFDLYVDRNIPFADAYHAGLMRRIGLSAIATFDRDFDKVPGVMRLQL